MQSQAAAPQGAGHYPNPYLVYGAPSGFAPLTDEAGVYLPTGPGDAQRMELLNMPGDGSDVWLDVRGRDPGRETRHQDHPREPQGPRGVPAAGNCSRRSIRRLAIASESRR